MKNENKSSSSKGGIGFFGLLGILFIALKLIGVINWSWWLVLLPVYGGLAIALGFLLIALVAILVGFIIEKIEEKKDK